MIEGSLIVFGVMIRCVRSCDTVQHQNPLLMRRTRQLLARPRLLISGAVLCCLAIPHR